MSRHDLLSIEDRHGRPGGLHYAWHVSAFLAALGFETATRAGTGALAWIYETHRPPMLFWPVAAFGFLGVVGALFWHRHTPMRRFRWYRRAFRNGTVAHGIGAWLRDVATYYASLMFMFTALMVGRY